MWSSDLIKKNGESIVDMIDNQIILAKTHREK